MKTNYKKTFWGSILAFFIGTSCCWLSSLAIWLGGVAFLGTLIHFIENIQLALLMLGTLLGIITAILYFKKK